MYLYWLCVQMYVEAHVAHHFVGQKCSACTLYHKIILLSFTLDLHVFKMHQVICGSSEVLVIIFKA